MSDSWQSGTAYEGYMGRWSRLAAQKFLSWLGVGPAKSWLDVGCGTGSLTRMILEHYQPKEIFSIDSSSDFIAFAAGSIRDPAVHFRVGLAQALEFDSNSLDAAVSGLVLNFVPQPEAAIAEMGRVIRPGGDIGIYIWDYARGMQMLRYFWDAAVELDPGAREHDEDLRFPICREGQLEALARAAGLRNVEAGSIEVPTVFRDFEDYWQPVLGGAGPASGYTLSLDPDGRQKLADRLRERLPTAEDGSIALTARAWAMKGKA